ncbi:MAG: hypothetical protein QOD30_455 [Actinomycetota bacterium]|jgi:undecaprenyl-diphosphatase|nr:hypothetical protein [Actinomycetota bacterium]
MTLAERGSTGVSLLDRRLAERLGALVGGELAVLALLAVLVWHSSRPDRVDAAIARALYAEPGTTLRWIADRVSLAGAPPIVALAAIGVGVWTWWRCRDLLVAVFCPFAVVLTSAASHALKLVIERPRPATAVLLHEVDFSYPSGHATGATALALTFVLLVTALRVRPQRLLVAGATAYVVAVCISRLFLGVHYPSDVVGGVALGGAGVLLAGWACS